MDNQKFRERLSQILTQQNLAESKVSVMMGRSRTYLNHIINGRSSMRVEDFLKFCTCTQISPIEFFHTEGTLDEVIQKVEQDFSGLDAHYKLLLSSLIHGLSQQPPK
ncbi:helix-turn-helix transcriptional regulator [Neobittarella massiliensis]|uniref:helix-turn-helix domain-containing protein n=1 Tax=Neobittarella massiliensis (ex Bilen et al. 2018) TaxID=2041842 RepID=UPI00101AE5F2|nr:helix-turn-helix transcriptional regulator [Neobittarella massiliensis]